MSTMNRRKSNEKKGAKSDKGTASMVDNGFVGKYVYRMWRSVWIFSNGKCNTQAKITRREIRCKLLMQKNYMMI